MIANGEGPIARLDLCPCLHFATTHTNKTCIHSTIMCTYIFRVNVL